MKQRERHRKGEAGEGKREKVADRVELIRGGNKSHLFFLLVFFLLFFHRLVHKAPFERMREDNRKNESERAEERERGEVPRYVEGSLRDKPL